MNLVTGLWGMNVHVPGQDIDTGVSGHLHWKSAEAEEHRADAEQYAWFGGILGGLALFALLGAFATVRYPF